MWLVQLVRKMIFTEVFETELGGNEEEVAVAQVRDDQSMTKAQTPKSIQAPKSHSFQWKLGD